MATNGWTSMKYYGICDTAFYCQVVGTDLAEDTFRRSSVSDDQCLIGSYDNKFLILEGRQFQAELLTTGELDQPDCRFNFQFYSDRENNGPKEGRAVMVYVCVGGKTKMVSCNDEKHIVAEEMDLPDCIPDHTHRAVFYRRERKAANQYLLESSLHQQMFLAFEPVGKDPTLSKLVLLPRAQDEVDTRSVLSIFK